MLRALERSNSPRAPKRRCAVAVETLDTRTLLSAAVISWEMAPRVAVERGRGNAFALPNTPAYVSPAGGFQVLLDASKTPGLRPASTFTWTVSESGNVISTVQGKKTGVTLPEGSYTVHLSVGGVRGARAPVVASEDIVVDDVLIVSIGDSYASGEGNPVSNGVYFVKSAQWAYSPDPAMKLQNAKGHRSTLSAPAQFALALEQSDPHQSVTFVSVANSGARIDKGLLGSMLSNVDADYTLPGQIDQVRQLIGSRSIDALTVSIGGNDIGFSTRLKELASNSLLGNMSQGEIRNSVNADLADLPQKYAALDRAIDGLNPGKVLITEYPDITGNQKGQYAPIRLMGVSAISKENVEFADRAMLQPLNRSIETAAAAHGWTAVDYGDEFRTHGYASTDSWVRSFGESLRYESSSIGAFHPNFKGQQAIAKHLLDTYNQTVVASMS
ncbi:SGNH/GDSL hydrolase family protein [Tundrisphaera sp. TA3]|uniref:SGNH/GDSL hydrolase family protein n=1 Tax=Tundrisphaera sp. TA3 TaxID=3435775 RepID=UPI003EB92ECA